jgi:Domain of unknown function (DUF1707)
MMQKAGPGAGMAGERAIRASDADRDQVAATLGDHHAAGRLTLEEFQERLDRAYAAKTLGELSDLMADLPRTDLSQLRGQPGGYPPLPERREPGAVQAPGGSLPTIVRLWLMITVGLFALWLISGASGGPWFLWIAIPLAFIMLRRWSMNPHRHDRQHRR